MTGDESDLFGAPSAKGIEPITRTSLPQEKIALFRSLFRGRTDVFPLRFESRRSGKSGYQPACANEWVRDLCDKPRIKCFDCPNRRSLSACRATCAINFFVLHPSNETVGRMPDSE